MEGHEFERYNSRWNSLDFSSQISSLAHELHSLGDEDHNDANVEAEVAADLGQWSSPFLPRVRGARTTETPNEMYISPVRYSLANNSQLRETGEEDFDATTNLTFSEEALSQPSGSADKNIKKVVSLREVLDSPDSLTYSANGTPSTSTSIATMLEDIPTSSVTSAQGDNLKSAQKSLSLFLNGDEEDLDEDEYSEVSCIIFKEKWREKEKRIRKTSQYSHVKGWRLVPVIVKSNDDLRQEQLAGMLIKYMHTILQEARVDGYLHPYDIVALNADSGLIEAIPNTVSLDVIKKKEFGYHTLSNFFETFFGPVSTAETSRYCRATNNFIESIAAYSIVCYLLNVKDRHNGNILLTTHGHIIHIDFGFLLGELDELKYCTINYD